MTTGLDYNQYVTELALLAVVSPTDPNFVSNLPSAITYGENRIYRDLQLLATQVANTSYACTALNRIVAIPSGTFVTIQNVNIITPAGTTNPTNGTRNPVLPVTKEYLDNVWGSSTGAAVPTGFALLSDTQIIFGPWPDQNYTVELVGTFRPESLSLSNPTTFISLYLPDLFLMASMIQVSGYQRNFGAQAGDPAMAQSYEAQYQALLKGATMEAFMQRFEASGWTAMSPSPVATTTRV